MKIIFDDGTEQELIYAKKEDDLKILWDHFTKDEGGWDALSPAQRKAALSMFEDGWLIANGEALRIAKGTVCEKPLAEAMTRFLAENKP